MPRVKIRSGPGPRAPPFQGVTDYRLSGRFEECKEFERKLVTLTHIISGVENYGGSSRVSTRGEFFIAIVRTRYSTKDPALRGRLQQLGVPAKHLGWPKITPYVDELAKKPGFDWIGDHYTLLCEFVHHNLPSTAVAASDLPYGRISANRKGIFVTSRPRPQITYAWPSDVAADGSVRLTASRALNNVDSILELLKNLPTTPYTSKYFEGTSA